MGTYTIIIHRSGVVITHFIACGVVKHILNNHLNDEVYDSSTVAQAYDTCAVDLETAY